MHSSVHDLLDLNVAAMCKQWPRRCTPKTFLGWYIVVEEECSRAFLHEPYLAPTMKRIECIRRLCGFCMRYEMYIARNQPTLAFQGRIRTVLSPNR